MRGATATLMLVLLAVATVLCQDVVADRKEAHEVQHQQHEKVHQHNEHAPADARHEEWRAKMERQREAMEKARLEKMSPEEREQYLKRKEELDKFRTEHQGHDAMHFEMFLLLMGTLVVAQIALTFWKQRHFESYQSVTLVGLFLFPIYFALRNWIWKLLFTWSVFSIAIGYVAFITTRQPLSTKTPRQVFWIFALFIKMTQGVGVFGYIVVVADFFIGPYLPKPANMTLMSLGLTCLFYGLYFGVMSRDFADLFGRTMATSIGYYSPKGISTRRLDPDTCAVCGGGLKELEDAGEASKALPCGHVMHEFCIRGWCIIGKKQTCPYCKEKVDLKQLFPSPWARTDAMYAQLLDVCRYFVVWYPVIIHIVQGEFYVLGLH